MRAEIRWIEQARDSSIRGLVTSVLVSSRIHQGSHTYVAFNINMLSLASYSSPRPHTHLITINPVPKYGMSRLDITYGSGGYHLRFHIV